MLLLLQHWEMPAFLKVITCMQQLLLGSVCQHLRNRNAEASAIIYIFPGSDRHLHSLPATELPRSQPWGLLQGEGGVWRLKLTPGDLGMRILTWAHLPAALETPQCPSMQPLTHSPALLQGSDPVALGNEILLLTSGSRRSHAAALAPGEAGLGCPLPPPSPPGAFLGCRKRQHFMACWQRANISEDISYGLIFTVRLALHGKGILLV